MKMQVGFRLEKQIIETIDKIANSEFRNRSNMVEYILIDYIIKHYDPDFADKIKGRA